MDALSLLYHDVTPPGEESTSGFPGPDAAIYKLTAADFEAHLSSMAASRHWRPGLLTPNDAPNTAPLLLFTFDDGGHSALTQIAPALERHGWRGYFFIATQWIGQPGFLNPEEIRTLAARGHCIGSHSHSHPLLMARLSPAQLDEEWRSSVTRLKEILGAPVDVASVPGGHYSPAVARSAARAGIRLLFNSEPTTAANTVDGCLVLGRFSIQRPTPLATLTQLAAGDRSPIRSQWLFWNSKKALKKLGGPVWLAFRRLVFSRRSTT